MAKTQNEKRWSRRRSWLRSQVYCGDGYGCTECRCCRYMDFREWAESVAPSGSSIFRDKTLEGIIAAGSATFQPE